MSSTSSSSSRNTVPSEWPPRSLVSDSGQIAELTTLATTYALSHALVYLPTHPPASSPTPPPRGTPQPPSGTIHAPLSLLPSPVPRTLFERATGRLQGTYDVLYARVAMDHAFIDGVVGGRVAEVDTFAGELWRVWKSVRGETSGKWTLGVFRSDYLLHRDTEEGSEGEGEVALKQVEFNTIAASFGALAQQVAAMHRYLLASTAYFGAAPDVLRPENLPPNETTTGIARGIAEAHKLYGVSTARVLFVVQPDERNVFDQRMLEYALLDRHGIHVVRQTLPELTASASLSTTNALIVSTSSTTSPAHEISVVYFRAGYAPSDYPSPSTYATRALLDKSAAVQCPSLALQLAGTKKVQEALARPGVLERFLHDFDEERVREVRETWVGMWSLDARADALDAAVVAGVDLKQLRTVTIEGGTREEGEEEEAGTALARARASELVLKPQREGGGNNVYRDAIPGFLDALPAHERCAWIAMELIKPPREIGSVLVRAASSASATSGSEDSKRAVETKVVSELGVFGVVLFGGGDEGEIRTTSEADKEEGGKEGGGGAVGWLVRTKASGVDEGGVAAGFSVLDSVVLV